MKWLCSDWMLLLLLGTVTALLGFGMDICCDYILKGVFRECVTLCVGVVPSSMRA